MPFLLLPANSPLSGHTPILQEPCLSPPPPIGWCAHANLHPEKKSQFDTFIILRLPGKNDKMTMLLQFNNFYRTCRHLRLPPCWRKRRGDAAFTLTRHSEVPSWEYH